MRVTTECNICGSTRLAAGGMRGVLILCQGCGAYPVTRVMWLMMVRHELLTPGKRVLHVAPERALAPRLRAIFGEGYEPVDLHPANYADVPGMRQFDLCRDAALLASQSYDLILHSHVMEHVRCNVTAVLFHLHRALRPGGHQVCCIPFVRGRYSAEDFGSLTSEQATERFGQHDHVRMFGALDAERVIGMIFALPRPYDLTATFGTECLDRHVIPAVARSGWTPQSVLVLRKEDLLLSA